MESAFFLTELYVASMNVAPTSNSTKDGEIFAPTNMVDSAIELSDGIPRGITKSISHAALSAMLVGPWSAMSMDMSLLQISGMGEGPLHKKASPSGSFTSLPPILTGGSLPLVAILRYIPDMFPMRPDFPNGFTSSLPTK